MSAESGVEAGTVKTWKYLDRYNIPRIVCLNKIDKEHANFETALEAERDMQVVGFVFDQAAAMSVHNARSPQKDFGSPGNYPDDQSLDAVSGDGRPDVGTLHNLPSGYDWAMYRRGTKRLRLTADLTIARLKEFREGIPWEACCCRAYFGLAGPIGPA
jgi:hypothetical protein